MTKGERAILADVPTALYRFYDSEDRLLYVGITHDLEERWRSHKRNQLWWLDVARKEHVWLPNRAEAEEAEDRAIRMERPVWDKSRAPRRDLMTTSYDNPRKDPYEEKQVRNAAQKITEAVRAGDFPAWSFLPVVNTLADRLRIAVRAADLGRRRLSFGSDAILTQSRHHFIVAPKGDFPVTAVRRRGELYVLAQHHFGADQFTTQQLAERSQTSSPWKALAEMERSGLVIRTSERPPTFRLVHLAD